jgi:uncharacterized protein YbjT (DUF2867 family)
MTGLLRRLRRLATTASLSREKSDAPLAPRPRFGYAARMKVLLFGATGMIGSGVLRVCLDDPRVTAVTTVGRRASGVTHAKLTDLVVADVFDLSAIADRLAPFDACFFCLGISSAGHSRADYARITRDLTLATADLLLARNPGMTFVYLSAGGVDSTGRSPFAWARVRGDTENRLKAMPFRGVYLFRPGLVQPMPGAPSKTLLYRVFYLFFTPFMPVFRTLFPFWGTSVRQIGLAMIAAVEKGHHRPLVTNWDINRLV